MPTSLYDALGARGLRPTWAEDSVTADVATADEADLLEVDRRRRRCCGTRAAPSPATKVVEVSRTVYRADRYTLWVQLGPGA